MAREIGSFQIAGTARPSKFVRLFKEGDQDYTLKCEACSFRQVHNLRQSLYRAHPEEGARAAGRQHARACRKG